MKNWIMEYLKQFQFFKGSPFFWLNVTTINFIVSKVKKQMEQLQGIFLGTTLNDYQYHEEGNFFSSLWKATKFSQANHFCVKCHQPSILFCSLALMCQKNCQSAWNQEAQWWWLATFKHACTISKAPMSFSPGPLLTC